MDELVKASVEFMEFLILGATALGLIAFSLRNVGTWRSEIRFLLIRKDAALVQAFFLSVLAAGMYFIGIIVAQGSAWILEPSHYYVITAARQQFKPERYTKALLTLSNQFKGIEMNAMVVEANVPLLPDREFYRRPFVQIINCFTARQTVTNPAEINAFILDYTTQAAWERDGSTSFSETFKRQLKHLKLLRGAVFLLPMWLVVLGGNACFQIRNRRQPVIAWIMAITAIVLACPSYFFLMNCLWVAELDSHSTLAFYEPHRTAAQNPTDLMLTLGTNKTIPFGFTNVSVKFE
jgi:hypothetical protein